MLLYNIDGGQDICADGSSRNRCGSFKPTIEEPTPVYDGGGRCRTVRNVASLEIDNFMYVNFSNIWTVWCYIGL